MLHQLSENKARKTSYSLLHPQFSWFYIIIHSPNHYCYRHYYYCHLFSSTLRFNFITLFSLLDVNGFINWSLLIWGLHLINFAGFPFPYFPFFQIVDIPVLRVSKALKMNSPARRWQRHNLRGVFRLSPKYCKRLWK